MKKIIPLVSLFIVSFVECIGAFLWADMQTYFILFAIRQTLKIRYTSSTKASFLLELHFVKGISLKNLCELR